MVIYNFGSSAVYAMWSRGHFPLSLNDCSYLLNERFSKYPVQVSSKSCCYCCCPCREFPCNIVSNFPSFLYGLRQSNLIQWSASKRLILGGLERNFSRLRHYEIDRVCYNVPHSAKQGRICNRSGRRRRLGCFCVHSEESIEFDSEDDAEALLRVLSDEEEIDEYCDCCERRRTSYERVNGEKKRNYGKRETAIVSSRSVLMENRLRNSGGRKKLSSPESKTIDKKRYVCCKCSGDEMGNGCSDFLERKSNNGGKKIKIEPRKENYRVDKGISTHSRGEIYRRRKDGSNNFSTHSRGEIYRRRKDGSNNSYYYSFPTSDTSENDTEIVDKHSLISEELTNKDRSQEKLSKRKLKEEIEMRNLRASQQENSLLESAVKLESRKKHVKKISQVSSIEETKSVGESSQMQSRVSMATDEGASSAQKNFKYGKDYSTSTMSLDGGTETQNEIMRNQTADLSSSGQKYDEFTEASGISSSNFGKSSWSANSFSAQRNEAANFDQKAGNRHNKIYGVVSEETNLRQESKSQKQGRVVKFQEFDYEGNSSQQRKSTTEVSAKESTISVKASAQETNERLNQTKIYVTGNIDSRQTSQNVTEISVTNNSNSDSATVSGLETIIKSEEHEPVLASMSHQGRKNIQSETDIRGPLKLQSGSVSQEVDISKTIISTSEETFRERIDHEERKIRLQKRPVIQTRKENNQTSSVVLQIEPGKVASPDGESSFQESLRSPQTRTNVIDKEESNRFSEEILIPPSSQLVTRGDFRAVLTSGTMAQKVSGRTTESGSSFKDKSHASHYKSYSDSGSGECYREPLFKSPTEDALGSAARFDQSSAQFVAEFIKQARAEVSTSEIQKEEMVYGTNLLYEGQKEIQRSSSHYGLVDIEMKDHDSRGSSQGSGSKAPDDDMWHVTEPAVEKSSKVEELQGSSETENAIVKRSGRSLWNIIGDIVRLRWVLRAETSKTSKKSGGKSSSSESNSNETWFSGREPEENIDNDAKTGRIMLPESTSSERLKIEKSPTQIEEASNKTESENVKYHDADPSSPPSIKGSGSTLGGNLLVSEEEVSGSREDGNRLPVVSMGAGITLSSLPLPAESKRKNPIAENISLGGTDASSSSLVEPLKLELSKPEVKGGELKLRKFQRTAQVSRDRFDEWEEAYLVENEQRKMDEMFMREALTEAKKAADLWEVPVGAVLVRHGKIIARGFNLVEELRDSTAHAEIICIREASNLLKSWRLAETTLYVTLEPCPMCAGAILQARVDTLVWGAPNKLLGADGSWIRLFPDGGEGNGSQTADKPAAPVHPFHPNMRVRRGVLSADCADVMQQFFQRRRRKKEKEEGSPPATPSCLPVTHSSAKLMNKMHDLFHMMFCL